MRVRLGTATPGGGFPVYGAAFVEGVRRFDPTLEIEAINTKGSTENVPMLEAGTLDIALVQGEVVHESLQGIGRAPADLRVLTAMYPTAGMFVVRADSPYHTIADLKGKPIAWGAGGSGLVILGRYAMDGLGLDAAKDFQPIYLERAGDGPAMVLDGRRQWLARIHDHGQQQGRRALHRARRRRDPAHPRQAHFPQAGDAGGGQLSRAGGGDPFRRILEFRAGAARTR